MFEQNVGAYPQFTQWKDRLHGPAPRPNYLYFTPAWPGSHDWASGKYFKIVKTPIPTPFSRSYTLPASDYKNLDLSNASGGLNLYPDTKGQVHEILIGFKPGNYVIQFEIPSGVFLTRLPQASMIPSTSDATLKYLGAVNPEDSPHNDPTVKIWAIKDMPAVTMRLLLPSGVDFDKCTAVFKIARHVLKEIPIKVKDPATGDAVPPVPVFTSIPWHEELQFG